MSKKQPQHADWKDRVRRLWSRSLRFCTRHLQMIVAIVALVVAIFSVPFVATRIGQWFDSRADIVLLVQREAELARRYPRSDDVVKQYLALFDATAEIRDVGRATSWTGLEKIEERFRALPLFSELDHQLMTTPEVLPDGTAIASTTTFLTLRDADTNEDRSYTGTERWSFASVDGGWKITRFRYNFPYGPPQ